MFLQESFLHNFTFHLKIIFLLHKVKSPELNFSSQKNEKFFNFFYNVLILNKYFHPSFYLSLMWKVRFPFHIKVNSQQDEFSLKKNKIFFRCLFLHIKTLFYHFMWQRFLIPFTYSKNPGARFFVLKKWKKIKIFYKLLIFHKSFFSLFTVIQVWKEFFVSFHRKVNSRGSWNPLQKILKKSNCFISDWICR